MKYYQKFKKIHTGADFKIMLEGLFMIADNNENKRVTL